MKPMRIFQFWLFLFFCSYLSLTPAPPTVMLSFSDKLLHSVGYMALYLSCSVAYPQSILTIRKLTLLLSYSIMIEVFQHFIPNRGFSLFDILANACGLILGLILVTILTQRIESTARKVKGQS